MNNEMTTDKPMSNEEVIEILKGIVFNSFDRTTPKERQALVLAFKSLEERPQGDLISREALKKQLKAKIDLDQDDEFTRGYNIGISACVELIDNAPTSPQCEWIPVSERLPEDRDWYLGQFKEPDTDFIGIPYICDYVGEVTKGTTNEGWILRHCTDVDNPSDYFRNLICVAWQPLPEPPEE